MFFQLTKLERHESDTGPPLTIWGWEYRQGTSENPGEAICEWSGYLANETAARQDIARARKAFSGARYARVANP